MFAPAQPLVLSRALCRFERFRPPAGLSREDQARAARLRAEAEAPFGDSGVTLLRQGDDIAIWYWDRGKVAALAVGFDREHGKAAPESIFREVGDGWRIVACLDGYEAQYWEDGALLASTWRREFLTQAQWTAFTFSAGATRTPAPPAPPEVSYAPWRMDGPWRRNQIVDPFTWRDAERLLLGVAAAGLLAAALFAGQGAHGLTDAMAARATIEAASSGSAGARDVRTQETAIRTFNEITGRGHIVETAIDAFEVFKILRIEALDWKIDQRRFEARIANPAEGGSLTNVVKALEESPGLKNVAIQLAQSRDADFLDVTAEVVPPPEAAP